MPIPENFKITHTADCECQLCEHARREYAKSRNEIRFKKEWGGEHAIGCHCFQCEDARQQRGPSPLADALSKEFSANEKKFIREMFNQPVDAKAVESISRSLRSIADSLANISHELKIRNQKDGIAADLQTLTNAFWSRLTK